MKFIKKSVEWIIREFNIDADSRIIDLGCGPGIYTTEFAKTGAAVTGIDLSENSIAYAVKKAEQDNLKINYINANYLEHVVDEKYNLVTLIFCDYCALSPDQRKVLLCKIYSALDAEGYFVFDVLSDRHFADKNESSACYYFDSGGFWSANKHFVFENILKYDRERVILEKDTVIEETGQFTIFNYLQCFTLEEIKQELADNGLKVVEYFSDVSGTAYTTDSREIALVARR